MQNLFHKAEMPATNQPQFTSNSDINYFFSSVRTNIWPKYFPFFKRE